MLKLQHPIKPKIKFKDSVSPEHVLVNIILNLQHDYQDHVQVTPWRASDMCVLDLVSAPSRGCGLSLDQVRSGRHRAKDVDVHTSD